MFRPTLLVKAITYFLILIFIYPLSPLLFKKFIEIKEPFFICPIAHKEELTIRSDAMGDGYFGASRSGGKRRHKGLDIAADVGEAVVAAKSGFAEFGYVPHGMGKYVKITHTDGAVTIYGHLSSISIDRKIWVWQGKVIGKVGKTGNADYQSIRPHLHFEIRKDGKPVNPLLYIGKK